MSASLKLHFYPVTKSRWGDFERYLKGARYVEAYPVNANSPSYRFMDFKPGFEKAGFDFVHKAGSRRNVMTIKL